MKSLDFPREATPQKVWTTSKPALATTEQPWNSRRATVLSLLALFVACLPLFFFRLGTWGFFDADEGRYGEIPRAMLASGDYVTPMLNGVKFFDKPPLLYWLIAVSYRLFGLNEGAARLVPALAALGAVWGAWLLGRRMFGVRAGLMAGVILATSFVWPVMARVVLTDMLVSSLVFLSLAFWWLGRSEEADGRVRWLSFFGFWTAMAFGVLAKGPIAVVLTGGSIGLYLILSGERTVLRRMGWISGVLWALLLAAPWFVVVAMRNGEFNKAFWIDQNFGRFLGQLAERDHDNGPFYFFELFPLLFSPWTFFAPMAIAAGWKKLWPGRGIVRSEKAKAALFLSCGGVFMTLFFSASQCKLVTYILPVMPLMAVALAGYFQWFLEKNGESWTKALRVGAFILAGLLVLSGAIGAVVGPRALEAKGAPGAVVLSAALGLLIWGGALFGASLKYHLKGAITATAVGFCMAFALGTGILKALAPTITTEPLLEKIKAGVRPDTDIVSLGFIQSLSFYTGKRVAMVGEPDELRSGIQYLPTAERHRWFLDDDDSLRSYLIKPTPVYFVMRNSNDKSTKVKKFLLSLGNEIHPVVRSTRYTILANDAALKLTPPDASVLTPEK